MFTHAIVRPPASNFGDGLTTAGLGAPDYQLALTQHEAYCAALERCGLRLTRLAPDSDYPDSTFVEDVAILIGAKTRAPIAILTRPGADTRRGEVETMRTALAQLSSETFAIEAPGTLDGGDVCQANEHFFIGVTMRTNEAGAQQLAKILQANGYSSSLVDIRRPQSASGTGPMLHLKIGMAHLGGHRLVITEDLEHRPEFAGYDLVRVNATENYAANCVRVNDYVLLANGFPKLENDLRTLGFQTLALDMSEFQKMDGGLSCLSLRF